MKSFRFNVHDEWGFRKSRNAYIVEKSYNYGGGTYLSVHSAMTGEPLCIATTNVPGHTCEPGNVLIKTWSENTGVYEALLEAGVIGPVIRKVRAGFAEAYECKYLWSA